MSEAKSTSQVDLEVDSLKHLSGLWAVSVVPGCLAHPGMIKKRG